MIRCLKASNIRISNVSDQICYDLLPHEDCHDNCWPHFCTNQVKTEWVYEPFQKQDVGIVKIVILTSFVSEGKVLSLTYKTKPVHFWCQIVPKNVPKNVPKTAQSCFQLILKRSYIEYWMKFIIPVWWTWASVSPTSGPTWTSWGTGPTGCCRGSNLSLHVIRLLFGFVFDSLFSQFLKLSISWHKQTERPWHCNFNKWWKFVAFICVFDYETQLHKKSEIQSEK